MAFLARLPTTSTINLAAFNEQAASKLASISVSASALAKAGPAAMQETLAILEGCDARLKLLARYGDAHRTLADASLDTEAPLAPPAAPKWRRRK